MTRHMRALLALVLVVAAVPAGAQGAEGWSASLGAPDPGEPRPDSVTDFPLVLTVSADGVACGRDQAFTATLQVDRSDAAEGVILDVPATPVNLTFPAGAHAPGSPVAVDAEVPAQILVARYAEGGAESRFLVTATLEPVEGSGPCAPPPETLTATLEVAFTTAAVPPGDPLYHPTHEAHGEMTFDAYLEPGDTFEFTFKEPGRYPYHDHLDPERKGMIRVLKYATNGSAPPEVRITAAGFEPDDLAVPAGTTVTWVNEDDRTRTVSADEQHGAKEFGLEPEDRAALKAQGDKAAAEDEPRESPAPAAGLTLILLLALSAWRRKRL